MGKTRGVILGPDSRDVDGDYAPRRCPSCATLGTGDGGLLYCTNNDCRVNEFNLHPASAMVEDLD